MTITKTTKCNACGSMVTDNLIADANEVNTGGDTICVLCHADCCPEDDRILRVSAGEGDDYDEGTLDHYEGDMAVVRWDSGVTTPCPMADLRRLS